MTTQHNVDFSQDKPSTSKKYSRKITTKLENNIFPSIDIYMTPSFTNGRPTNRPAITVFDEEIKPEYQVLYKNLKPVSLGTQSIKQEQSIFQSMKESLKTTTTKGFKDFSEDVGYHNQLRKLEEQDGLIYFYSENKEIEIDGHKDKFNTIQMLICVTMYGEERSFLENTLASIASNLPNFKTLGISQKQIVVIVLQDGIMKMREDMVGYYSEQDEKLQRDKKLLLRRGLIESQIDYLKEKKREDAIKFNNGLPTTIPTKTALLYQNELTFKSNEFDKLVTFSVFKHLNGKKLSSHLWFFEGFCRELQPKYCALVDVGTLPSNDGLVQMYKALEGDQKIGGVCGFMGLRKPIIEKLNEEDVEKMKQDKLECIQQQKKEYEWMTKKFEKQMSDNMEKKFKKMKTKNNRDFKKKSICGNFFEKIKQKYFQKNQNQNAKEEKSEQILNIEKKKREIRKYQIIMFNVFYLLYFILLVIKYIFDFIVMLLFKLIVLILKYFLKIGSLPEAQNYEYTTAHMIDKNFESALGFLHVLPGAWSAYRYKALIRSKEHRENLIQKRYLKQIMYSNLLTNTIQELNMFLAEDRILCLGIYCQQNSDFYLKYVPDAKAFTDPVEGFEEFLSQRRRWINSSWFAFNYVLQNYKFHVEESSHSTFYKSILLPFNMYAANFSKWATYYIPALYIFVSILSSYQFLQPSISQRYSYIKTKEQYDQKKDIDCKDLDDEPSPLCNDNLKENCYFVCEIYKVPSIFFASLNIVPLFFILILLLILFASLIFKPKKVDYTIQDRQELENLNNNYNNGVDQDEKSKKRRNELRNLESQCFQNKVFKVLASIISITSLFIVIIVSAIVVFSAMNNNFGLTTGFKKLKKEFLIYIYVMLAFNYGSFYLSMLVHLRQPFIVWNVLKSFLSYVIYSPIYNHILMIYSFCNIDDVSWGTKGLTGASGQSKQFNEKIEFVATWISLNALLLTALLIANVISTSTPYIIMVLGAIGSIYSCIKTMIGIWHYLKYFYFDKIIYWHRIKGYMQNYQNCTKQLQQNIETFSKEKYQQQENQQQISDEEKDFINESDEELLVQKKIKQLKKEKGEEVQEEIDEEKGYNSEDYIDYDDDNDDLGRQISLIKEESHEDDNENEKKIKQQKNPKQLNKQESWQQMQSNNLLLDDQEKANALIGQESQKDSKASLRSKEIARQLVGSQNFQDNEEDQNNNQGKEQDIVNLDDSNSSKDRKRKREQTSIQQQQENQVFLNNEFNSQKSIHHINHINAAFATQNDYLQTENELLANEKPYVLETLPDTDKIN